VKVLQEPIAVITRKKDVDGQDKPATMEFVQLSKTLISATNTVPVTDSVM
jgi:hypothetical protein